jgi:hypothetical protein
MAMKKARVIKTLLVLAQLAPLGGIVAVFVLKTTLYFLLSGLPLLALVIMANRGALDCIHCGTPLFDSRTIGRFMPVRPSVIDDCGECHRPLFE